jgi:hypothetical protein
VADSGTALLKYCYIDVSGETDPAALFEAYQRDVDALKAANPGLTILHVTLPLQTDWGEYFHWKRVIRGKLTTHRELNHIRQDYNERLRAAYAGREPIFDLAHLQSIGPDGKVHTVRYRRSRVPILARAWTYDGGHLNEEGRRNGSPRRSSSRWPGCSRGPRDAFGRRGGSAERAQEAHQVRRLLVAELECEFH